jgi:dolichol-phosphate mannosyltransferase
MQQEVLDPKPGAGPPRAASARVRSGLFAIIPTYRAAGTIVRVITKALPYVDHVVVVDDACPQQSGRIAREAFSGDERVTVIVHATNKGVGGATKTGFAAAIGAGASMLLKLDADDQMDPRFVPVLTDILKRNSAVGFV